MRARIVAAVVILCAVFSIIYVPAVGRGLLSDDFGWIESSRAASVEDVGRLFLTNHGFYRPIVALSFAGDYALGGMRPNVYGATNLALLLASAALLYLLLRALKLPSGAAAFGCALWAFNFHGINMALLWVSGRTALLLVLGGLVALLGVVTNRSAVALLGLLVALFSEEEALVLPVMGAAAVVLGLTSSRMRPTRAAMLGLGSILALALYFALRAHAGAITPASAPAYYRPSLDPRLLGRNLLEYADRAATFAAAATLVAWATLRPPSVRWSRQLVAFGAVVLIGGYALTVWLPVRSSLYACFPSLGAVIVAAHVSAECWRGSTLERQRQALLVLVLIPVVLAPIYVARNHRWTDLADLSSSALRDIATNAPAIPDGMTLVLLDDRSHRVNLDSAFGTLVGDAVLLTTGRSIPVWVEPPLTYGALAGMKPPCARCPTLSLQLRNGHLTPPAH